MSPSFFIVFRHISRMWAILVFFLLVIHFTSAQTKQIDSLLTLVNNEKEDTTQVNTLNDLSKLFYESLSYEKSLLQAQTALSLATKINYTKGEARAYSLVGMNLNKQNEYSKALENHQKSLLLYQQLNMLDAISTCYNNMGLAYGAQSNYSMALDYHFKALKIDEQRGNQKKIANSYNNIGLAYYNQGNYTLCLKYYLDALKIREKLGDEIGLGKAYNNIGLVHYQQGNYSSALEYYLKALKIRERLGDLMDLGNSYNNIGVVYYAQDNYPLAMYYYKKALEYRQKTGDKELISSSYNNIALIYYKKGEYSKALEGFNKELAVFTESGNKSKVAKCFHNIGNCYFFQKKYDLALSFQNKSLALAEEINSVRQIFSVEKSLSEIYEKLHDNAKSLAHYKKYIAAKDSLYNETKVKEFVELEAQYKFNKEQEKQQLEQEKKDALAEAEAKQKNYLITILIGISILLLLAILIVYLLARQKALRSKYKHIELKQKLLRGQMNPHFISNALSALQYVIYKNDKEEVRNYLSKFSQLFRYIIESTREDYVLLSKEIKSLEQYLELHKLLMNDTFEYKIEVDSKLDKETVMIPPMMAQPFIENAIKHGIPKSSVGAQIIIRFIYKSDNRLLFEVQDNCIYTAEVLSAQESSKEEDHKSYATIITEERLKH